MGWLRWPRAGHGTAETWDFCWVSVDFARLRAAEPRAMGGSWPRVGWLADVAAFWPGDFPLTAPASGAENVDGFFAGDREGWTPGDTTVGWLVLPATWPL